MYRPTRPFNMYNNKDHRNLYWRQNPRQYTPQNQRGPKSSFNNEDHWCETCDRGFPSLDLLEKHKQQHQKCNIDGCQFVAHPKVITKHIQMQHSSGLYKKIAKLDNPEEIKKWREERKKRYPTKDTIDRKSAEIKEKVERGEKMGLKYERTNQNYRQGTKRKHNETIENQHHQPQINRNNFTNSKKHVPKKLQKPVPLTEEKSRLKPFNGIQDILKDFEIEEQIPDQPQLNFLIEDDDNEKSLNSTDTILNSEPVVCGALSSLICDYGSSDEEDIEKDIKVVKPINVAPADAKMKIDVVLGQNMSHNIISKRNQTEIDTKQKSDDDSGPEEVKVVKKTNIEIDSTQFNSEQKTIVKHTKNTFKNKTPNINEKRNFKKLKPKLPSTLLHKLLSREMRQERNIILQCIRYIKTNKYFE